MRLARAVAVVWTLVYLLAAAEAQNAKAPLHLVQDWSARHVVFTGLRGDAAAARAQGDPRALSNWAAHGAHSSSTAPAPRAASLPIAAVLHRHTTKSLTADWSEAIFGSVTPRFSPAKFSFDINAAPDCTNDYVVFPTTNTPTQGQSGGGTAATLVAFNNLYTGPGPSGICPNPITPSDQPTALFAYNTATTLQGAAHLSPALSLDGKKVAFIESNDGFSNDYTAFHVLTWKAGEGTPDAAALPGDCSAGNSCMTTLVLSKTHSDSFSSPFIDYHDDVAYVADDGGTLHKIASVFRGTPTEVVGNGWPLSLTAFGGRFGSPVLDSVSGNIFISDNTGGQLFVIDAAFPRVVIIFTGYLTLADPIVDSTNQTVFLVACKTNSLHLVVDQFDTAGNVLQEVDGGPLAGDVSTFAGAFDNNYFNDPSTGSFYFAGAVNGVASLLQVGFTGTFMNGFASGPLQLSTSSSTSLPESLTEVFNPNLASAQDRLFVGIDENCTQGSNNGCIESLDVSSGLPATILDSYAVKGSSQTSVSGMVIDNVSSTPQAANVYVVATPATGTFVSGIKLTQSGLQ